MKPGRNPAIEAHHKPQFIAVSILMNKANFGVLRELQPLKVVQGLANRLAFVLDVLVSIKEFRSRTCLRAAIGGVDVNTRLDQFLSCSRAEGPTTRSLSRKSAKVDLSSAYNVQ